MAHVTVCPTAVHPGPETNDIPAGSVSVATTPVAGSAPTFWTVTV